jgi:hypothetical protein
LPNSPSRQPEMISIAIWRFFIASHFRHSLFCSPKQPSCSYVCCAATDRAGPRLCFHLLLPTKLVCEKDKFKSNLQFKGDHPLDSILCYGRSITKFEKNLDCALRLSAGTLPRLRF